MGWALVIAGIALIITVWFISRDGMWIINRHIGMTCPVCDGMGRSEDGYACRACGGKRIIWDRPGNM